MRVSLQLLQCDESVVAVVAVGPPTTTPVPLCPDFFPSFLGTYGFGWLNYWIGRWACASRQHDHAHPDPPVRRDMYTYYLCRQRVLDKDSAACKAFRLQ